MATQEFLLASNLGDAYVRKERMDDYTWIFALDIVFAFAAAYGIGANDVANAFGTSVGSRALTMRQAVVIASIFEFTGAFFLGAEVTNTISGGIADGTKFIRDPELLMFGMMCVDLGVAIWLILATYLELPVSTTHSVVGGVMGMALVLKGGDAVIWSESIDDFPYLKGVSVIVISWISSPLCAAIGASLMFFLVRLIVLRSAHAFDRSFICLPFIVLIAVAINLIFLITKGGKNHGSGDIPMGRIQIYSWSAGAGAALITLALMPFLKKKILREKEARIQAEKLKAEADDAAKEGSEGKEEKADEDSGVEQPKSWFKTFVANTIDHDVHAEAAAIEKVQAIHDHAEKFDPDVEEVFKYLQVFTACCNALAHGANDVANAIGPLAAVEQIWRTGTFSSKATVEKWVLVVGGLGLVIGLATFGYNIIRALGLKLSRITSSRGFCIELGAAMTVIVASNYGLPISTTHCLVGATVGVGALEGQGGVNWLLFAKMFAGWVMTLVMAGGVTAFFVFVGAYSPSVQMAEDITAFEDGLRLRTNALHYTSMWTANAQFETPDEVLGPNLVDGKFYLRPSVPAAPEDGVPNNKFFQEWKAELWDGAIQFEKNTSWRKAWDQAVGFQAPDWKGQNASTISYEQAFMLFDKVFEVSLAPVQHAEVQDILAGNKVLCCEEVWECCPRKCDYKKVNEDCVSKCEAMLEDPDCVEEPCDEDDLVDGSLQTASKCILVDTEDDCPRKMELDNEKNYLSELYESNPITQAPPLHEDDPNGLPWDSGYGADYNDWREPWDKYSAMGGMACPVKF